MSAKLHGPRLVAALFASGERLVLWIQDGVLAKFHNTCVSVASSLFILAELSTNGDHGQQKTKKRLTGKLSPSIPSPVVCGLGAGESELTAP
jgi:hypothetical protein